MSTREASAASDVSSLARRPGTQAGSQVSQPGTSRTGSTAQVSPSSLVTLEAGGSLGRESIARDTECSGLDIA